MKFTVIFSTNEQSDKVPMAIFKENHTDEYKEMAELKEWKTLVVT